MRCSHCGGKFGMARQASYYMTRWGVPVEHQFCSKKCKEDFDKARQQERRVLQFLQWLHAKPP